LDARAAEHDFIDVRFHRGVCFNEELGKKLAGVVRATAKNATRDIKANDPFVFRLKAIPPRFVCPLRCD
jgi:hypothetical protein